MNTKKFLERLMNNWTAKVICLALAIFIYIFHSVSLLEKKSLSVPLKIVSQGVLAPVSNIPSFVKVNIRTKSKDVSAIDTSSINAVVRLTPYTEKGVYNVPVDISVSEDLMLLEVLEITAKPETIQIQLDEKIERYIPIEASVSGEVDRGYKITNVEVVPSTVKVIGAESVVNKMNHIYTGKVNVKGAAKSFSSEVSLDNITSIVAIENNARFRVEVTIEAKTDEKVFENIVPSVQNLDVSFSLERKLPPISFSVSGDLLALEKYKLNASSVFVDCTEIKEAGTYELPIRIVLPPQFTVKERTLQTVKVAVVEKAKEESE